MIELLGSAVDIFRVFWCNPTEKNQLHAGCGNSFEIKQTELLSAIISIQSSSDNYIALKCPYCAHLTYVNPKSFKLSDYPYRVQSINISNSDN